MVAFLLKKKMEFGNLKESNVISNSGSQGLFHLRNLHSSYSEKREWMLKFQRTKPNPNPLVYLIWWKVVLFQLLPKGLGRSDETHMVRAGLLRHRRGGKKRFWNISRDAWLVTVAFTGSEEKQILAGMMVRGVSSSLMPGDFHPSVCSQHHHQMSFLIL